MYEIIDGEDTWGIQLKCFPIHIKKNSKKIGLNSYPEENQSITTA